MTRSSDYLLLYGLFRRLRAAGLPLQIRDYLEGWKALQLYSRVEPFKALASVQPAVEAVDRHRRSPVHRVRERPELVWLCQTLWARTREERQIVRDVITLEIELPSAKLIMEFHERVVSKLDKIPETSLQIEPPPAVPFDENTIENTEENTKSEGVENCQDTPPTSTEDVLDEQLCLPADEAESINISIVEDEGDVTLPSLLIGEIPDGEAFSMVEETVVSPLWLVALWRRLFIPFKQTDPREIDPAETVNLAAKTGKILSPVMRLRRINTVRLLLLIDVSEAMSPWRSFVTALTNSLDPRLSRLNSVNIAYFSGAPGRTLFLHKGLREPKNLEDLLKQHRGGPALVVGEAGAATGHAKPNIADRMNSFLGSLPLYDIRPLVWVNPMPEKRWNDSHMRLLKDHPNVHAVELNHEALLRAIDLMRGVCE